MKIRASGAQPRSRAWICAFTLLEVMIALTIFFLAIITILGSVSRSLGAARSLQQKFPDISALVADLMLTNKLEEGTGGGDFGDLYPGYTWTGSTNQIATNGLFQIDFVIRSVRPHIFCVRPNEFMWQWPATFIEVYLPRLIEQGRIDQKFAATLRGEIAATQANPNALMITPLVVEIIGEKIA